MKQQPKSTETASERAALNAYLDDATTLQASADLKRRIMASYAVPQSPSVSGWLQKLFSGVQIFPVGMKANLNTGIAAGFAASVGALGLMAGMVTTTTQAAYPPEYEAYAYLEQSGLIIEEEGAIWDED